MTPTRDTMRPIGKRGPWTPEGALAWIPMVSCHQWSANKRRSWSAGSVGHLRAKIPLDWSRCRRWFGYRFHGYRRTPKGATVSCPVIPIVGRISMYCSSHMQTECNSYAYAEIHVHTGLGTQDQQVFDIVRTRFYNMLVST